MNRIVPIYWKNHRYELLLTEQERYVISQEAQSDLQIMGLNRVIVIEDIEKGLQWQENPLSGEGDEIAKKNREKLVILSPVEQTPTVVDHLDRRHILIGPRDTDDLRLVGASESLVLRKKEDHWLVGQATGELYWNNEKVETLPIRLEDGDELAVGRHKIRWLHQEMVIWGPVQVGKRLAIRQTSRYELYEDFPHFHRSPRLIYHGSEEKLTINTPPGEVRKPTDELLRLIIPPLVMISVTALITIFQPRGLYILATVTMSIVTIIFSVSSYIKNRKQYKQDVEDRRINYRFYLKNKAREIHQEAEEFRKGQLYHYPGMEEVDRLAAQYDHRIYEKTVQQADFLHYRLGLGKVSPSYEVVYPQIERSQKTDDLEEAGYQLYLSHREISGMPIVAALNRGPVGYLGPRELVVEQLQWMIHQLALFHSYHDVKFVPVVPEEELADWAWMRWLPHVHLEGMNVRSFVSNQRTRDQVMNSLLQIMKQREIQQQAAQKPLTFLPHYVVVVTQEELLSDHAVMEYLTQDPTALGVSLVMVKEVHSQLAENIRTIIQIKDIHRGELLLEEGRLKRLPFELDHFPNGYDKERVARRLAPLRHVESLKSSIPDAVTFLEMYGVDTVDQLQIRNRWEAHAPYRSLAVPLGWRGQGDIVELNLHEKAHGPHGLIAGTTGSGKSELIQSYILSLAVNFHPHDVAFLLIDYKGGGMANLFKDLPHLLGTITNLDGNQAMRALASIKAENRRRQALFSKYGINHIHAYQKKYKMGEVSEPLPHLFIISDEFAELKAEQPEFIAELVSTARIGRSLGVNLILATQKPSGVVNDQIWSNSNFRIALKVADRTDSQEMLHTPDAAGITQAGRAYLQVGNNEVYELFQSAWSGADYQAEKELMDIEDQTIYRINALGQYEPLTKDLSGLDDALEIAEVPTELQAVIAEIDQIFKAEQIAPVAQPWLPPLADRIYLADLQPVDYLTAWQEPVESMQAVLGVVDIPSQQKQEVYVHDAKEDGHLVLFGAPLMGKSTFIQTMAMGLARRYSPEDLHFYLFDFGTNGLLPLRGLPQVADVLLADDLEKITKGLQRLQEQMKVRKQLLREHMVANIEDYRAATGKGLPYLYVMVDSYDNIKEHPLAAELESSFQSLARDGLSLGIVLVLTAGRTGAIRPALLANLKTRISLKLTDDAESRNVVGRTTLQIEDKPGRGLVKMEEPEIFQMALPCKGDTTVEILQAIQTEASQMAADWQGRRPKAIPVVPENVTFETFAQWKSVQSAVQAGRFPLGLDMMEVESISLDWSGLKQVLFVANDREHLDSMVHHLLCSAHLIRDPHQLIFFDLRQEYRHWQAEAETITDGAVAKEFLQSLVEEIAQREAGQEGPDITLLIPDLSVLLRDSQFAPADLEILYQKGWRYGIRLLVGGLHSYLSSTDTTVKQVRAETQYYLFGMRLSDQTIVDKVYNSREAHMNADEIYLYGNRKGLKLKISQNE